MIMNENAKLLIHEVKRGLELSPLVKVDIQAYADYLDVSLRSAQRYIADLEEREEFIMLRRKHDGSRYFKAGDSPAFAALMNADHTFDTLPQNGSSVVSVACDSLSYLYIYISKSIKNKKKAVAYDKSNDNGDNKQEITIWYDETSGDMQELASAVCHVCKLSALLLLDEDEAKIFKLFKAGVTGPAIMERYAPENKPNYWWSGYWKGRDKNARPSIVDIMQTWEKSFGYVYKPVHAWPPVNEIQKTIAAIMIDTGPKKPKTALVEMSKYGYDEIVNRIPGGYVHMTKMSTVKMDIEIAKAVRSIREEEKTLVRE